MHVGVVQQCSLSVCVNHSDSLLQELLHHVRHKHHVPGQHLGFRVQGLGLRYR